MASVVMPALQVDAFSPIARRNRHFDIEQVHKLAVLPAIVDLLTRIYSPDLCVWRSHIFTGKKGHGLGWHSDYFRTLLTDPLDHLTLHFAITAAPEDNCLMVVPGSQNWTQEERSKAGFELIGNTLDRGYGTPYYIRNGMPVEIRKITLRPGEFFVFNPGLLHASIDRVGDRSNASPLLALAKKAAKNSLAFLGKYGLVEAPSRLAIGFRYCNPRNSISPIAFRETLDRGHCPALVAGKRTPEGSGSFADWRGEVTKNRENSVTIKV